MKIRLEHAILKPLKLGSIALSCYHERSRAGIPTGTDWLIGEAGSVRDGTQVRIGLRLAHGRIVDARYEVFGCPAAIAAAAWAAERLAGAAPAIVTNVYGLHIAEALELPVEKTGVALVVEDAICNALAAGGILVDRNSASGG